MNTTVIQTENLSKKYGDFTAVDNLNIQIQAGEVFGLLGPNGAGKTTTILMVLGLTEPTAGFARILGLDPVRRPLSVKSQVGYMPDQVGFYDELTARENLTYIARLNGQPSAQIRTQVEEVLERVGLQSVAGKKVATFSRGMRQRLGLADVLIKKPQLIIMDEPTSGLDPEASHEFLQMVRELKDEGITILLSSHFLHQVQTICDRVGLFNQGKLMAEGTVHQLAERALGGAYRFTVVTEGPQEQILQALQALPEVAHIHAVDPQGFDIEASKDIRHEAAQAVITAGGRLFQLEPRSQSLDDVYSAYFKEVSNGTGHIRPGN